MDEKRIDSTKKDSPESNSKGGSSAQSPQKALPKVKLRKRVADLDLPQKNKMKAVAIKYDLKKDKAPKIMAIGKGSIAEKILNLAEEHHVPMAEDKTLTDLLSKLEIDNDIPPNLFTVVAEILAFVYQLDKLAKKRNKVRKRFQKK